MPLIEPRATNTPFLRRVGKSLSFVGLAAVFFLLATGIVIGILEWHCRHEETKENPYPIKNLYCLNQYTGYGLIPGLNDKDFTVLGKKPFRISTTADGLRGTAYPLQKKKDVVRILAIGSSFTFGWGVDEDETWPVVLERRLNASAVFPAKFEIINGALPGTHGDLFIRRYIAACRKYKPDIVFIETQPEAPEGAPQDFEDPKWLIPDTHFEEKSVYYIDDQGVLKTHITHEPFWHYWVKRSALMKRIFVRMKIKQDNDAMRRYWDSLFAQPDEALTPLLIMNKMLEKEGAVGLVMIRHWAGHFQGSPTPQQIMVRKLAERNIPAVDLRPLYEPYENERRYLLDDGHWNAAGHALAAEEAFKLLVANRDRIEKFFPADDEAGTQSKEETQA
jgi:lysophospholipase L1-like esterase